jgi:hypothetical protein
MVFIVKLLKLVTVKEVRLIKKSVKSVMVEP